MLKEKISLKRLVGLSQEDGEKLLLAAGYIQDIYRIIPIAMMKIA